MTNRATLSSYTFAGYDPLRPHRVCLALNRENVRL